MSHWVIRILTLNKWKSQQRNGKPQQRNKRYKEPNGNVWTVK